MEGIVYYQLSSDEWIETWGYINKKKHLKLYNTQDTSQILSKSNHGECIVVVCVLEGVLKSINR